MAAGIMRLFGRTTKGQFLVIGLVLIVLGVVGAALVLTLPNEDPVSPIISSKKVSYYRGVSLMAVLGLLLVAGMGIILVGVALTGLPLVHAARYHVGVFYVTFFSLLIIPAAVVMRMGALMVADAMSDTIFAEAWEPDGFSSPAGLVALGIGIAVLVLAVLFVILNVMGLARVSYKPSIPRRASVVNLVLALLAVYVLTVLPFLPAIQFDYQSGLQTAVGFETYPPMDVTITQAWLEWLGQGETKSAYGSTALWLSLMTWMLFLTLVFSVLGFIGIALYGANERRPIVYQLSLMPIVALLFSFLAIAFYFGFNGALTKLSNANFIDTEETRIFYEQGLLIMVVGLALILIAVSVVYGYVIRRWLSTLTAGKSVTDPISEESMVDPPTALPDPPTGWPARMDRMSIGNWLVIVLVVVVLLSGMSGGYYVKKREAEESTPAVPDRQEVIDLWSLPQESFTFNFDNVMATENAAPQNLVWTPTGGGYWFIESIDVVVIWTDETPNPGMTNEPDLFNATIIASTDEKDYDDYFENRNDPTNYQGEIRVQLSLMDIGGKPIMTQELPGDVEMPSEAQQGSMTILVGCISAGDTRGPLGLITIPDSGNIFTARVKFTYRNYK